MFAHIDADSFFASVLQRKYPKLKNKPVLALGMGGGCVIAASYEAKDRGVKTGMCLYEAKKLVPEAIAMPSDFQATYVATRELFTLLERFSPEVERSSPDEGFLDLTHACLDTPNCVIPSTLHQSEAIGAGCIEGRHNWATRHDKWVALALKIQSDAHQLLDLPVSIGIAPTKTLAKMGSNHNKPKGTCVITPANRMDFLREKPIDAISGIGARLTPKMHNIGCFTAFDFAQSDRWIIEKTFGKTGLELQLEIQGTPVYPVITKPAPPKSISRCRSFKRTSDVNFLFAQLITHLQRCSTKLRRYNFECGRLGIWLYKVQSDEKLKPIGFKNRYRSRKVYAERIFGRHLSEEALLIPFMKDAFREVWRMSCRVPQCGLASPHCGVSKNPAQTPVLIMQTGLVLSDFKRKGGRQLSLFASKDHQRIEELQKAIDSLRRQYGSESVRLGSSIVS